MLKIEGGSIEKNWALNSTNLISFYSKLVQINGARSTLNTKEVDHSTVCVDPNDSAFHFIQGIDEMYWIHSDTKTLPELHCQNFLHQRKVPQSCGRWADTWQLWGCQIALTTRMQRCWPLGPAALWKWAIGKYWRTRILNSKTRISNWKQTRFSTCLCDCMYVFCPH